MSATAHSALRVRTGRRVRGPLPRTGIASRRPLPCSATSTATRRRPQWADVGMYLQTVMLLLRAEGLHSCTQMAWSVYRQTVTEVLSPPDRLILFCGMSIRYEDMTVRYTRTGRAPLDETVTFVEG